MYEYNTFNVIIMHNRGEYKVNVKLLVTKLSSKGAKKQVQWQRQHIMWKLANSIAARRGRYYDLCGCVYNILAKAMAIMVTIAYNMVYTETL